MTDRSSTETARLKAARKGLKEMEERIAPFTKKRERGVRTTAGQWQDTGVVVSRQPEHEITANG